VLVENVLSGWPAPLETGLHSPEDPRERIAPAHSSHAAAHCGADAALAEACRSKDIAAFEQFYETHGAKMKSIAYNLLGNTTDAEDAVQETFLKVFRGIEGFKGDSAFSTWVTRILINNCYDMRRRRVRRPEMAELEEGPGLDGIELPPASGTDHPLRMMLERSLARLSERNRTVFVLFEIEGFSHAEIAATLGISEASSKNTLFTAKRELRGMLGESRKAGAR
jgi:RNA polymerase sigma-70 factor (ECF subfamily)